MKDNICNTCQGKTYVAQVTADGAGNWSYSASFLLADVQKYIITATQAGASPTNTSEFSPCSKILPVELISFHAVQSGVDVLLNWKTASEKDNRQFIVQASSDGQSFSTIGTVDGAGNSSSVIQYSFTAFDADPANTYFRLIQVDLDGKRSVSPVIYLGVSGQSLYSVSPNPFNGEVTLYSANSEEVTVNIYNTTGQQVYQTTVQGVEGAQVTTIDLNDLKAGMYVLVIYSATSESQFKLIKQ